MNSLMFLTKPWETDPRVSKEKEVLEKHGHTVVVDDWKRIDFTKWKTMMHLPSWQHMMYKKYMYDCDYDIIHCHDFDTLRIGVKLKKRFPYIHLIYDAHEMYSYMVGLPLQSMERKYLQSVDTIIAVNPGVQNYLEGLGGRDIKIVYNAKPLMFSRYKKPSNDIFTIGYFGSLHENRMFPSLFHIISGIDNMQMVFSGNGMRFPRLPDDVVQLPFMSEPDMYREMRRCDLLVCMFDPNNLNCRYGLPNKVFEAMMVGRPILCTSGTLSGNFVKKHEIGATCSYANTCVRVTLEHLRDDPVRCEKMGKTGLRLARSTYNWDVEGEKLLEIYR